MKLLHTSDWHLGRRLYGRSRHHEFSAFLDWLLETIGSRGVDALVVAGDIFDTGTPAAAAQQLYYRFLCRLREIPCCRDVVVVAGNHDSPGFLEAPKEVLGHLGVHVVGTIGEEAGNELLLLNSADNTPALLLAAVPYLRDREMRRAAAGEGSGEKAQRLVAGIEAHYAELAALAEEKRLRLGLPQLPLVATGHLFAAGGRTVDGDGVRELYVGSLARVGAFPASFDYVALGHLHVPQRVGGAENLRYSGSPIAMGFGEAKQQKVVLEVEVSTAGAVPQVTPLAVPCFQRLERVEGSPEAIFARLDELRADRSCCWLEIVCTTPGAPENLRQQVEAFVDEVAGEGGEPCFEVLRVKNAALAARIIDTVNAGETLEDLDEFEVFERCLDAAEVTADERQTLRHRYQEVVRDLYEQQDSGEVR